MSNRSSSAAAPRAGGGRARNARSLARRVWAETFTDRTFMVAAGLAFFATFGLLPAIAVAGLAFQAFVSESALEQGLEREAGFFPEDTPRLLVEFLTVVPAGLAAGLGLSLNLIVVLYTVQRAASGLITALNVVFDEDERRSRLRREGVALLVALAALAVLFASLFLLALAPLVAALPGFGWLAPLLVLRWPLLAGLVLAALALCYRYAPCRSIGEWRPILASAGAATLAWIAASALFALYMDRGGGWEAYYGSITTPIVLMTWIFLSAFIVMAGAELNAQIEARDHPEKPPGAKEAADRSEGK